MSGGGWALSRSRRARSMSWFTWAKVRLSAAKLAMSWPIRGRWCEQDDVCSDCADTGERHSQQKLWWQRLPVRDVRDMLW
jgi:hypothetical protein